MKTFKQYLESMLHKAHELPDMPCRDVEKIMRDEEAKLRSNNPYSYNPYFSKIRQDFVEKYSWSILCKEVVDFFKKYARPPLYDVMAGSGYWAAELTKKGIKTIASDAFLGDKNTYGHKDIYHPIEEKDALEVMKDLNVLASDKTSGIHGDVLMAWPPYAEPIGKLIVERIPIGGRVFYIGEGRGGATGDDQMHDLLDDKTKFKLLDRCFLPTWSNFGDHLWVYERIN